MTLFPFPVTQLYILSCRNEIQAFEQTLNRKNMQSNQSMLRFTLVIVLLLVLYAEGRPYSSRKRRGLSDVLNAGVAYAEFYARRSFTGKGDAPFLYF